MSTGYKLKDQEAVHFLTFTIVGWVDIFSRKIYRDTVIESFKYCQSNKGLEIFGYVIMSNHIHIIARSLQADLSGFIRDFKSFTSKAFLQHMESNEESRKDWLRVVFEYHGKYKNKQTFQVWTHDYHAEQIFSQNFFEQKLSYIHQNPVKAGLVENPEDYIYSSARNYANMDNLINITKVDLLWKTI